MSNLVSFTPLMRQTIGFDRFNDMFESLLSNDHDQSHAYPPYNIEKTGEDAYLITLAVAGFTENDLDITVEDDRLIVAGRMDKGTDTAEYLHRGIATRDFERTFRLADHIKVEDASMDNGMLRIALIREVPEEKKPRMIPINGKSKSLLGGKAKTKK